MKKSISVLLMFCLIFVFSTSKVQASSWESVSSVDVTHTHSGSTSAGGGCYTTPVSTNFGRSEVYAQCTGTVTSWTQDDSTARIWHPKTTCGHDCSSGLCGNDGTGRTPSTGVRCKYKTPTGVYRCNNCYSTICSGVHVTSYNLGCGLEEGSVIGQVSVQRLISSQYELQVVSNLTVVSYSWSTGSSEESIVVNGNGVYSCEVVVSDGSVSKTISVTYEVTDFDTEPPVFQSLECTEGRKNFVVVKPTFTDNFSGVSEYKLE